MSRLQVRLFLCLLCTRTQQLLTVHRTIPFDNHTFVVEIIKFDRTVPNIAGRWLSARETFLRRGQVLNSTSLFLFLSTYAFAWIDIAEFVRLVIHSTPPL